VNIRRVAAYRRAQRSSLQLSLRVGGHQLALRGPEQSRMALRRRWQHYKYRRGIIIIITREKPLVAQKLLSSYENLFGSALYSRRSSAIKPSCSETMKSLHRNGNPLKQKRRCSNIPGRLHQSPAQLAQERKSIPVDGPWDSIAMGTNSPCSAYLSILDPIVRKPETVTEFNV